MKISLRDLVWTVLSIGLALGLTIKDQQLNKERSKVPCALIRLVELAPTKEPNVFSGKEQIVLFNGHEVSQQVDEDKLKNLLKESKEGRHWIIHTNLYLKVSDE